MQNYYIWTVEAYYTVPAAPAHKHGTPCRSAHIDWAWSDFRADPLLRSERGIVMSAYTFLSHKHSGNVCYSGARAMDRNVVNPRLLLLEGYCNGG